MAKADNANEESGKGVVPARGVPVKLVLLIGAGALLIGLGATFAFLKFSSQDRGGDHAQAAMTGGKAEHGEEGGEKNSAGHLYDLDPFIVNLADTPEIRYLKLTVKLELDNAAQTAELTARTPQVRDAILVLLSSKDSMSLRTTQGKFQLREELAQRVNATLPKKAVRTVYFTEFVLQ